MPRRRPMAAPCLAALAALAEALALAGCSGGRARYPILDRPTAGVFLEEERAVLPAGVELRGVGARGLALTKASEGFVGRLYLDAARYCTIAYGHLLKKAPCDGSEPEEFRGGVTEPRGAELLVDDMAGAQRTVTTAVKVDLTETQYGALCDFVYNVGGGNFRSSTLLERVNAGDHDAVASQLRRWTRAGGREWPGLVTRREREIDLYFDGLPKPRGLPPATEDVSPIDIRVGER